MALWGAINFWQTAGHKDSYMLHLMPEAAR